MSYILLQRYLFYHIVMVQGTLVLPHPFAKQFTRHMNFPVRGRLAGGNLAGGHLASGRLACDFFWGVGQLAGDFFTCYLFMLLSCFTIWPK